MWNCFQKQYAVGMMFVLLLLPVGVKAVQEVPQPASVDTSPKQTAQQLEVNQPIEREIKGGEVHVFQVHLVVDQFLKFQIEQKGIQLTARMIGPDGKKVTQKRYFTRDQNKILGFMVAQTAGNFRLEINPVMETASLGTYSINVIEIREAVKRDEDWIVVQNLITEAQNLIQSQTKAGLLKAIDLCQKALVLCHELNNKTNEASILSLMGNIYHALGEMKQAMESFQAALVLLKEQGRRFEEGITLSNLASTFGHLGDYQKALDYYQQALSIRQDLGDQKGVIFALNGMAGTYRALGEHQKARQLAEQVLDLSQSLTDLSTKANILSGIGVLFIELREYQTALQYLREGLQIRQSLKDTHGKANSLSNISGVYSALGDKKQALRLNEEALELIHQTGDKIGEVSILAGIGVDYAQLGETQKGIEYLQRASSIQPETGNRWFEAVIYHNLGDIHASIGNTQKAIEYFQKALVIEQASSTQSAQVRTLTSLGREHARLGEFKIANEYFNQANQKVEIIGDTNCKSTFFKWWAWADYQQGCFDSALTKIKTALDLIELNRSSVISSELRTSLISIELGTYTLCLNVLAQRHAANPQAGFDAEAFHVNERLRARSLMEVLREAKADIRQGIDPNLLEHEQGLLQRITAKEQLKIKLLNGKYSSEQMATLTGELDTLLEEHRNTQDEIRQASPHYANLTQPQPLTVQEIQTQVLDKDTLLLEYALGSQQSYLWAVSSTGLESFTLANAEKIEETAQRLHHILVEYQIKSDETEPAYQQRMAQLDVQYAAVSSELSQLVLKPAAHLLGKKRLLIVADGTLQYIPFAALPSPKSVKNEPLITFHDITYLPSASTLAVLRKELAGRPKSPKTLAIVADPVFDLQDPRLAKTAPVGKDSTTAKTGEFESVAPQDRALRAAQAAGVFMGNTSDRLLGTRRIVTEGKRLLPASKIGAWVDFEAVRARAVHPDLAQYQVVHFGTHGYLDLQIPKVSGLFFTRYDQTGQELSDHFLSAVNAYNLKLPAEMVVLQACETGLSGGPEAAPETTEAKTPDPSSKKLARLKNINPEGLNFLTRGFMYAGARRVMVSLWKIGDQSSSEVLIRMYRHMFGPKRMLPSAALRAAQLEMLKHPKWSRPYFWSGMVIHGEW